MGNDPNAPATAPEQNREVVYDLHEYQREVEQVLLMRGKDARKAALLNIFQRYATEQTGVKFENLRRRVNLAITIADQASGSPPEHMRGFVFTPESRQEFMTALNEAEAEFVSQRGQNGFESNWDSVDSWLYKLPWARGVSTTANRWLVGAGVLGLGTGIVSMFKNGMSSIGSGIKTLLGWTLTLLGIRWASDATGVTKWLDSDKAPGWISWMRHVLHPIDSLTGNDPASANPASGNAPQTGLRQPGTQPQTAPATQPATSPQTAPAAAPPEDLAAINGELLDKKCVLDGIPFSIEKRGSKSVLVVDGKSYDFIAPLGQFLPGVTTEIPAGGYLTSLVKNGNTVSVSGEATGAQILGFLATNLRLIPSIIAKINESRNPADPFDYAKLQAFLTNNTVRKSGDITLDSFRNVLQQLKASGGSGTSITIRCETEIPDPTDPTKTRKIKGPKDITINFKPV